MHAAAPHWHGVLTALPARPAPCSCLAEYFVGTKRDDYQASDVEDYFMVGAARRLTAGCCAFGREQEEAGGGGQAAAVRGTP